VRFLLGFVLVIVVMLLLSLALGVPITELFSER
jgi:hypothetical protein